MSETILIPLDTMRSLFRDILVDHGFTTADASICSGIFSANSLDGVYTHGVNRFAGFIKMVEDGYVKPLNKPSLRKATGAIEQWDGNIGPGPLNALFATERSVEISGQFGIGCVALSNTNHWMRGGAYGWHAAKKGSAFIGWTNTTALMPAWGASGIGLGNNPLVIAVPRGDEAVVLDMAMSQYSFGKLELAAMNNEKLAVPGGYDINGNMTDDAASILRSKRALPIGHWKGAGLALLLDMLAAILSGGSSTSEISRQKVETSVSQVFIAMDISGLGGRSAVDETINKIIEDYHQGDNEILYPGERVLRTREKNLKNGIPVQKEIWDVIIRL